MTNEEFSNCAYEAAVQFNVQQRFAAMMTHTKCWNVNRRGADMVAFISDRKADYKAAHPEMLASDDTICDHRHFTDFIMSGIWRQE